MYPEPGITTISNQYYQFQSYSNVWILVNFPQQFPKKELDQDCNLYIGVNNTFNVH